MSLGRSFAGHSLPLKLQLAARYGFEGIEIFYEDLIDYSKTLSGNDVASGSDQLYAARSIRRLCKENKLEIICLQPLMHYEALLDRAAHNQKIEDAKQWIQLAKELGTDLILLPSSFLSEEELGDTDLIIKDMIEIADLGAKKEHSVKFAYEALCWGRRVDTWEKSWDVVKAVNRPNFGVCLDTFNIAGRIYADPTTPSRRTPDPETAMAETLSRLVSKVDVAKVFLLQVADAEYMQHPLVKGHPFHCSEQPPRMSWSRNARLFYGEEQFGGYLPVQSILAAIIRGLQFEGWISFEVFNRRMTSNDEGVPEEMAARARLSWHKIVNDLRLEGSEPRQDSKPESQGVARASL